ncbi:NAD-dependent epimerase/dehydratase [Salinisphaera sp. T5B8]|uniref:GDP-L-fucose synthase family protein n=1 Tax=Salinisphaera sp. T5B8 TaxID=1304154 RepID=UPI00333F8891
MHRERQSRGSIYVAGHRGLVGSAIERRLRRQGETSILTRSSTDLDLTNADAVNRFFAEHDIDQVYLAAARVGGILANDRAPVDFLRENLLIQTHVIDAAYRHGVRKLLFLGSSCIYPKHAEQPIHEDALLTGALEPTNQWYAIAKIAGIKLCQAYRQQYGFNAIAVMPTNLYGPGDNFDLETSHVLPALIRKCHEAKVEGAGQVTIWGSGRPRREFLYVDDLADACVHLMDSYDQAAPVNVGVGEDISIFDLARLVADVVGFEGEIVCDTSKPDGTPRKLLDVSRVHATGWHASTPLRQGIEATYSAFLVDAGS